MIKDNKAHGGFTLIEITIVLLILGILLGSMIIPIGTQMEYKKFSETKNLLKSGEQALLGFIISNNRFPCPDISGDGIEDGPPCVQQEGWLPWATLGIRTRDSWGNNLRYHSDENFSSAKGISFPPETKSGLWVRDHSGFRQTDKNPNALAAIIYSCGPNGRPDLENQAIGRNQFDLACTNAGKQDNSYLEGPPIEGRFDDILIGISRYTLIYRMESFSHSAAVPK